ncbi:MAG: RidA family protein [Rhodobiaceae bacterium]|nr:RidA family protein [Rhodobiaceae bacterium]MCC0013361.1 RidA family protein [Rhodobiaceae bacterium]MCC0051351.1 RidA family protein [Rhodobiaceae bacterium]MCC0061523.1 RidA family protein [Rhodobiaceae bacterium]
MGGQIEKRLAELGISLPEPVAPVANYVPFVITGKQIFVSGQVPIVDGKPSFIGTCGATISTEDAVKAARVCAINLIAQAKAAAGDLDSIARVVKLVGFVNSAPDFTEQPKVINGASDLMVDVFGDKGRHARSAVGVAALPLGVSVEVEAVFELA